MNTCASPAVLLECLQGYSFFLLPEGVTLHAKTMHLAPGTYDAFSVQAIANNLGVVKLKGGA